MGNNNNRFSSIRFRLIINYIYIFFRKNELLFKQKKFKQIQQTLISIKFGV